MKSFIYIEPSEEGIDSTTKQIASRIRKISTEASRASKRNKYWEII